MLKFIKDFIYPKLYRIIEYDYGHDNVKYGIQYKHFGLWWDVIVDDHLVDTHFILTFDVQAKALAHIDFLNKYGSGPVTRIVDKVKIG